MDPLPSPEPETSTASRPPWWVSVVYSSALSLVVLTIGNCRNDANTDWHRKHDAKLDRIIANQEELRNTPATPPDRGRR